VVVTHHLPSFESVAPKYQDSKLSACFASKLDHLMSGEKVQLWIHGHTHDNFDYELNGTRVLCNPRGYYTASNGNENASFNPYLVADVSKHDIELMPAPTVDVEASIKSVAVRPLADMSMYSGFDPCVVTRITAEYIEEVRAGKHDEKFAEFAKRNKKP
jgi:hypothetical protein